MSATWKKQEMRKCRDPGWIVVVTVFASLVLCSEGFNVDTINFIRHSGAPGSMFGFSVAQHKEGGQHWALIGAPEAQTRQPGVTRGGSVFRCDVTRDDACEEIQFDTKGNNNNTDGRQIDKKSNQWFGATVRSSGETGVVLVTGSDLLCSRRLVAVYEPLIDFNFFKENESMLTEMMYYFEDTWIGRYKRSILQVYFKLAH